MSIPFNPVNLRPLLSVLPLNGVEIVSTIGFKTLEAANLLRFARAAECVVDAKAEYAEVRRAVYQLAREVQAQSDEQEGCQGDVARYAPAAMKMLGEYMFMNPLYVPSSLNGVGCRLFAPPPFRFFPPSGFSSCLVAACANIHPQTVASP